MAGHAGSAAALRTSKSRALGLGLVGVMLGAWLASPVLAAKPAGDPAAPDAPIPRATAAIESRPATTVPAGKSAAPSISPQLAEAERLKRLNAAKSWGYQLNGLSIEAAAASPYDLLVVDATTGLATDRHMEPQEVEQLKKKPDGARRLVVSYLSIGEAEDYRPDYFSKEYLEEDAPDWLMTQNPKWKGNRSIKFCTEGWQKTILGDDDGRNVYNGIDPSPLHRLIDLGFDGVYLDRVDAYADVAKECPGARDTMIKFVERLAAHARKKNPHFMVILQNAEELLADARMVKTIDAVAKEDLFYGADHSENANPAEAVRQSVKYLTLAKEAKRPVFVVDYLKDKAKSADAKARIQALGFTPYIAPRDLGSLWLPDTTSTK